MSDLKHMSADDLRAEILSLSKCRGKYEATWQAHEAAIRDLESRIAELRKKHHNLGQREAWARIYLARKT